MCAMENCSVQVSREEGTQCLLPTEVHQYGRKYTCLAGVEGTGIEAAKVTKQGGLNIECEVKEFGIYRGDNLSD